MGRGLGSGSEGPGALGNSLERPLGILLEAGAWHSFLNLLLDSRHVATGWYTRRERLEITPNRRKAANKGRQFTFLGVQVAAMLLVVGAPQISGALRALP